MRQPLSSRGMQTTIQLLIGFGDASLDLPDYPLPNHVYRVGSLHANATTNSTQTMAPPVKFLGGWKSMQEILLQTVRASRRTFL